MFKVGLGQDSHRFSEDENKPLVLGGIEFPGVTGFEGNSDGDVALHALCNALEQAVGGTSFSRYADEMCEDGITDSSEYLKEALKNIKKESYRINNVGISIEAKIPKIDPMVGKMKKRLAELLMVSEKLIGITATSGEGLTTFGRGEGVQVFAIISLIKKQNDKNN